MYNNRYRNRRKGKQKGRKYKVHRGKNKKNVEGFDGEDALVINLKHIHHRFVAVRKGGTITKR
jgi:hypothetical protein